MFYKIKTRAARFFSNDHLLNLWKWLLVAIVAVAFFFTAAWLLDGSKHVAWYVPWILRGLGSVAIFMVALPGGLLIGHWQQGRLAKHREKILPGKIKLPSPIVRANYRFHSPR